MVSVRVAVAGRSSFNTAAARCRALRRGRVPMSRAQPVRPRRPATLFTRRRYLPVLLEHVHCVAALCQVRLSCVCPQSRRPRRSRWRWPGWALVGCASSGEEKRKTTSTPLSVQCTLLTVRTPNTPTSFLTLPWNQYPRAGTDAGVTFIRLTLLLN